MKPSAREFLQLYCKIHRWKNDGGCAFYHNTWRIPNTALRKPNLYVTQAGTYEADIGSFLCWQRRRTRCDIENWGHFLPASWPTTSSHYVAGNNFVLATECLSKNGHVAREKLPLQYAPASFTRDRSPLLVHAVFPLLCAVLWTFCDEIYFHSMLLYFCLTNIHFFLSE